MESRATMTSDLIGRLKQLYPLFFVLAVTAFLRIIYLGALPLDRLDESYGRWLVDVLTIRNSWVYTGPALPLNPAVEWLPLFQYVSMLVMYVTGDFRILPLRATDLILSLMTVALLYGMLWRVFKSRWQATTAALFLAFQPWNIDYSVTASDRILLGLLIVALTYSMFSGRVKLFSGLAILTALTAYEGWFVVALEIALGIWNRSWTPKRALAPFLALTGTIGAWLLWNIEKTGAPFTFVLGYLAQIRYQFGINLESLSFYVVLATAMTTGIFLIGLTATLIRRTNVPRARLRTLAFLIVGYVAFYTVAHLVGFETGDLTGRIVPILPLIAASAAFVFPTIRFGRGRRVAIGLMLLLMLIVPYYAQISIGPAKAYVISPEQRVGEKLRAVYDSGKIICDVPAVIYFSRLDPSFFITSSQIPWHNVSGTDSLRQWLQANQVRYVVWQNSTESPISDNFPVLGEPRDYVPDSYSIGQVTFHLIYEDSLAAGNWEHTPQYGPIFPPSIFLYQVNA
jgi:hypothetical protein